jgi:hypothetical protein
VAPYEEKCREGDMVVVPPATVPDAKGVLIINGNLRNCIQDV